MYYGPDGRLHAWVTGDVSPAALRRAIANRAVSGPLSMKVRGAADEIVVPQGDYDFGHLGRREELADSVDENRGAVEQHELLAARAGLFRLAAAHTDAESGSGEDDRYFHSRG